MWDHTIYDLGNRQMIKCAPNLDLCSYKLYDK